MSGSATVAPTSGRSSKLNRELDQRVLLQEQTSKGSSNGAFDCNVSSALDQFRLKKRAQLDSALGLLPNALFG
jgi:hypothetical protein